jgi:hypothetical protein
MQLVLGVGRRSVVFATFDNVVSSFEILFLSIIQLKLLLLPVSGSHLSFHQDAADIRCRSTPTCFDDPLMHNISVRDRTSIKYTTVVIITSGLSAAMLDLMVVGNPSSFALHVPASAVPDSTIIESLHPAVVHPSQKLGLSHILH